MPAAKLPPDLTTLSEREKQLRSQLAQTEHDYAEAALRLINDNLPEDVEELIEQGATVPFKLRDLEMPRSWDCPKSPTGHCVYHPETDGALDDCIYCHQPDERK